MEDRRQAQSIVFIISGHSGVLVNACGNIDRFPAIVANSSAQLEIKNSINEVKVPISPKYFFRLNKSLHLFEMHCAFLPLLNPNINLLQAVKVTKSGHHLSHDRASKGYGSTPCLTSQTSLHACLQRLNAMQISLWRQTRNRPMLLLTRSCERWWLDFVTFTT